MKIVQRNSIERNIKSSEEPELQFSEETGIRTQCTMWREIRGKKDTHVGQERVEGRRKDQEIRRVLLLMYKWPFMVLLPFIFEIQTLTLHPLAICQHW